MFPLAAHCPNNVNECIAPEGKGMVIKARGRANPPGAIGAWRLKALAPQG